MSGWQIFWTVAFVVAGFSFAFITLVVTARGFRDLRELFARLRAQKERDAGEY